MRIYRVVIDSYPEGCDQPGWRPQGWEPGWVTADDCQQFSWPRRKNYFSQAAAYDRLALFQHYGATGRVETSHPVIWPEEVVV